MVICLDEVKFLETKFENEDELEKVVNNNSKLFFGKNTIYFDIKNKIDTKSLGSAIPDAFLFDFSDLENPEFYMVENEISKHDFYKHIFPQITKFFAFYNNYKSMNDLIEKLYQYIKENKELEDEFRKYIGKREIFKALKDIIENSQNILIILDDEKEEFQEVYYTYTDTWGKMVRLEILKRFKGDNKTIFTLNPDFENINLIEPVTSEQEEFSEKYTEEFHLEGVEPKIKSIYEKIKNYIISFDSNIKINPQKYYISLRKNKNFAFMKIRKKKIQIIIMLPVETVNNSIKYYKITKLSEGVQNFYNGPCFMVTLDDDRYLNEIYNLLQEAYKSQN